MTTGLTRALGEFVSRTRADAISAEARQVVATGFTDCVGVMIAGRDEPAVDVAREVFGGEGGAPASAAAAAAMIYGTAAHALDYDDTALRGHMSAVLVSAILAEAEALGASGEAMLTAYVVGYETWGELGTRLREPLHLKGWHPTAVFGTVAAAAACASLRRLGPEAASHALALAASRASGLTANFGSDAKPMQVGHAASAGLLSARLAAAGATGAADVLENPRGFLVAFSPDGNAELEPPRTLGVDWRIHAHRLNVKRYPVCYAIHRGLDAMLALRARHPLDPAAVDRIDLQLGNIQAAMLRVEHPRDALEAKFSARFCIAAAALSGAVGLAELADPYVARADVAAMMDRVHVETTSALDPGFPNYAPYDQVTVRLRDGRRLESDRVARPRGHASAPLSAPELRRKFDDCTATALSAADQDTLFGRLQDLSTVRHAGDITAFLEQPAAGRRNPAAPSQPQRMEAVR